MTKLPDYSEYLNIPGMLAWIEQEWNEKPKIHESHADIVNEAVIKYKINSIVEFGCGTGQLAKRLHVKDYLGVDSNRDCIEHSKSRNDKATYGAKKFKVSDVRNIQLSHFDAVVCMGFMKHFGLHEWDNVFNRVVSFGKYLIFDIPIGAKTFDDGIEFHHVWKSKQDIVDDIHAAGLELLQIVNPAEVEPVFICKRLPELSGATLEKMGWDKKGNRYLKGMDSINYDGTDWYLNGEKINNINDIPLTVSSQQ
jgi:SAM-dependent methyltransferase